MLDAEIELTNAAASATSANTDTFTVASGGADFAIGSLVDAKNAASPSMSPMPSPKPLP